MPTKLNHYWRIRPYKFEEYCKFMLNSFIPGINKLDVHVVCGWSVLIGSYSDIILETVANDLELLEHSLLSKEFMKLKENLLNYVTDYNTKILVLSGKRDSYTTTFQENSIKFNQTWNINSEKAAYNHYVEEKFYPCLEESGITVAAEWEVLIGDAPHIVCEGRAHDVGALIGNLQDKKFRESIRGLKMLISNYQSRILGLHIQKLQGCKSVNYDIIR